MSQSKRLFGNPQIIRCALVALHIGLFLALSCYAFARNKGNLFIGIDGAYMLSLAAHFFVWAPSAVGFFANPFQGLGDLWFNLNAWIIPGFLVPHIVLGQGNEFGGNFRVLAYLIFAFELFGATLFTARSIGCGWATAVLSAWSVALLLLPYFGPTLVYGILELVPQVATAMAETSLILALAFRLGQRRGRLLFDGALCFAIFALAAHYVLAYPTATILSAPVVMFFGVGLIVAGIDRYERKIKLIGFGIVLALLAGLGFTEFVIGIFRYSATAFWSADFEVARSEWYFGSIIFHGQQIGWGGPGLFVAGFAGMVQATFSVDRRLRGASVALLALVGVLLIFGTANALVDLWQGPAPLYFEFMMWPLYVIFASRIITSFVAFGWRFCVAHVIRRRSVSNRMAGLEAIYILPLAIIVAATVYLLPVHPPGQYIWPAPGSIRPIVKELKESIGIQPGGSFRGRVVTFEGLARPEPVGWMDFFGLDNRRAQATGNDDHDVGLWTNNIPTLLEYNQSMSPALYRVTTRLLARPGDRQVRNVLVLRQANVPILALLGVRYVIADAEEPSPLRLVKSESTGNDEILRLYEVPNVNLGTYSPLEIETVHSLDEAILWMKDPAHDLTRSAVVIGSKVLENGVGGRTRAVASSVHLKPGGIVVEANAPGDSLLVLPFEYSQCQTLRSLLHTAQTPRLLRVDAVETGILFTGHLSVEVRYFTGPFSGSGCRLRDAREFRQIVNGLQ